MKPAALDLLVCPHDATALAPRRRRRRRRHEGELTCGEGHQLRDPRRRPAARPGRSQGRSAIRAARSTRSRPSGRASTPRRSGSASRLSTSGTSSVSDSATRTACARFLADKRIGAGGRHGCRRRRSALRAALRRDGCRPRPQREHRHRAARVRRGGEPALHPGRPAAARRCRARASTSSQPTRSSTTRPTRRLPCVRWRGSLAPGGTLAFYVYKVKAPLREYADDYIRERTTKMSVDECMDFSAVDERARPQALGPRTPPSRSTATSRCSASRPASTTSSGSSTGTSSSASGTTTSRRTSTTSSTSTGTTRRTRRGTPRTRFAAGATSSGSPIDHLDVGDAGISVRATAAA